MLHRNARYTAMAEVGHSRRFAAMLQRQHTFQSGRLHTWQHRDHPHMYKPGSVRRSPVMPGDGRSDQIAAVWRLSRRGTRGHDPIERMCQSPHQYLGGRRWGPILSKWFALCEKSWSPASARQWTEEMTQVSSKRNSKCRRSSARGPIFQAISRSNSRSVNPRVAPRRIQW